MLSTVKGCWGTVPFKISSLGAELGCEWEVKEYDWLNNVVWTFCRKLIGSSFNRKSLYNKYKNVEIESATHVSIASWYANVQLLGTNEEWDGRWIKDQVIDDLWKRILFSCTGCMSTTLTPDRSGENIPPNSGGAFRRQLAPTHPPFTMLLLAGERIQRWVCVPWSGLQQ